VLSLPPAFVLSQDQTLKLKRAIPRATPKGRSAGHPFLTDEPLHIAPTSPERPAKAQTSSSAVHPSQGPKTPRQKPTNGEADIPIIETRKRTRPLGDRYARSPSVETNQTARISLRNTIMSNSADQKTAFHANSLMAFNAQPTR
jgi:hypothetical protein